VAALPGDKPLRLIGTSTGALVCALFAERHPAAVNSLFLMSPVRCGVLHAPRTPPPV
jgi:pimeloyl-ACP methyl ester carboxylesterase